MKHVSKIIFIHASIGRYFTKILLKYKIIKLWLHFFILFPTSSFLSLYYYLTPTRRISNCKTTKKMSTSVSKVCLLPTGVRARRICIFLLSKHFCFKLQMNRYIKNNKLNTAKHANIYTHIYFYTTICIYVNMYICACICTASRHLSTNTTFRIRLLPSSRSVYKLQGHYLHTHIQINKVYICVHMLSVHDQ